MEKVSNFLNKNNVTDYQIDKTITQLFEEQAARNATEIALSFEGISWTYKEVNEKANQIANYLIHTYQIQPNDVIALMPQRTALMPIGVLAILKTGACYLPLIKGLPKARLEYMLSSSNAKLLLTDEYHADFGQTICPTVEVLETIPQEISILNPVTSTQGKDLIFILFTSGSTGKPKGVEMPHKAMSNLIQWHINNSSCGVGTKTAEFVSFIFDVSFQEIFATWLSGGHLVMINEPIRKDLFALAELLVTEKVERIMLPFIALQQLSQILLQHTDDLQHLKVIVTAGEQLQISTSIIELFQRLPNCELKNHYGPTEAHVVSEYVLSGDPTKWMLLPPIGKPIWNTSLLILDKNGQPVPADTSGELHLGGLCLANGYLNNSELTAEKFIENPFKKGERLYKTGDLARQLPDGNIECLGRIDHQLKIRGYRVETGEIEQNLLGHQAINSTVVVAHDLGQGKELVAYLIFKTEQAIPNTTTLRAFLENSLPDYMIPSLFVVLEKFPQTNSGKVDRKALPNPSLSQNPGNNLTLLSSGSEYVAPQNNTEEQLAEIWQNVLNKTNIGINDNFFVLGGHSLKAIRLVSQVQQVFSVIIKLSEIFAHPTITLLAQKIEERKNLHSVILQPIPKIVDQSNYPLSNAQHRLWIPSELGEKMVAYNMFSMYEMEGKLNIKVLKRAFETIIQRHEILRTRLVTINGEPRQVITSPQPFNLPYLIWENKSEKALESYIFNNHTNHVFDLSEDNLLRAEVLETTPNKYLLLLNIHHIVSDGWSMSILIEELTTLYNAYIQNQSNPLPSLRIQYKDYTLWQEKLLADENHTGRLQEYWKGQLSDFQLLELPTDYKRPLIQQHKGETYTQVFSSDRLQKLEEISQKHQTSLFVVLTTFVKILLHKYTNQSDIIIGTGVAGRNHPDLYDQLGFYINMLALRSEIDSEDTFENTLSKVKKTVLDAFEHDDYPFDKVVEALDIPRNLSRNPVFDVAIILQNNEAVALGFQGLKANELIINDKSSKFDLTFIFDANTDELQTSIEYNTDLFERSRIERMITHLDILMENALQQPKHSINQLHIISKAEKQLLTTFNQTKVDFPNQDKNIVQLFEEQVAKTPNNIAVIFGDKKLKYSELNEKANQLGHHLRETYSIQSDDIIALQLERSEWMIIAILGVMKSGAAYLPIAPKEPAARVKFMLEDSNAKALLTDTATFENAKQFDVSVENIEQIEYDYQLSIVNYQLSIVNSSLVYIIYTSGSTGQPKGVMIEHRNVVNFITYQIDLFEVTPADNIVQFSTYTFDASISDIFMGILTGATLFVIDPQKMSFDVFLDYIKNNEISMLDLPPKFLNALDGKDFGNLKILILGGEAPDAQVLRKYTKKYRCFNTYGPTEATVGVTIFEIPTDWSASFIPIGSPFSNVEIHILDGQFHQCPIGIAGELCISGAGLARGYLNNPTLTAEKFIPLPITIGKKKGERLYKTGDLARWLPDGNIEFLGRLDHQLKIRGYRVEAGEIEQALLAHEVIQSAVIIGHDFKQGKELVAYLVPKTGQSVSNITTLRTFLGASLPDYMIPSYFVVLETLPLTSSGKINRKALPKPDSSTLSTGTTYVAPRNTIEEELVKIWQTVLNQEKIGINDNFFSLGGHSLRATRMVALIQQMLSVEIKLREIFTHSTIAELGQIITEINIQTLLKSTQNQIVHQTEELLEEEIW